MQPATLTEELLAELVEQVKSLNAGVGQLLSEFKTAGVMMKEVTRDDRPGTAAGKYKGRNRAV